MNRQNANVWHAKRIITNVSEKITYLITVHSSLSHQVNYNHRKERAFTYHSAQSFNRSIQIILKCQVSKLYSWIEVIEV